MSDSTNPYEVNLYDNTYGNFATAVLAQIRRETFGTDIGQNSWLTAEEALRFFGWLALTDTAHVLEIACGSGGPALFLARTIGCHVLGIDNNAQAITTANRMAQAQGLAERVHFQQADASQPLPFAANSFDAIVCIDALNHLPNRAQVFAEWYRVVRPAGRILFTNPITVTGLLSSEEIAIRSAIGYFLFTPTGEDERLLQQAGFTLTHAEDVTDNAAKVSKQWYDARAKQQAALIQLEGLSTYNGLQQFLSVVYTLSSERRLSRFAFLAHKPAPDEQAQP